MPEADDSRSSEICRELGQRLTRLTTLVTISAVFLVTTTFIVTQNIQENAMRRAEIGAEARGAAKTLAATQKAFAEGRMELEKELERVSPLPNPPTHASVTDYEMFSATLDAMQAGAAPDIRAPLMARTLQRLQELSRDNSGAYRHAESQFLKLVSVTGTLIRDQQKVDEAQKKSYEKVQKASVPVPVVGAVEIDAQWALVFLAITVALAYIIVTVETRRVLSLSPHAREAATNLAPSWIYTNDLQARNALGWKAGQERRYLITAMLLHAGWLVLSIYVASLFFLLDDSKIIASPAHLLTAAAVVGANLLALASFAIQFLPNAALVSVGSPLTRRTVLGTITAAVLGLPLYLLVRKLGKTGGPVARTAPLDLATLKPFSVVQNARIRNARKQILHGATTCRHHLPKRTTALTKTASLHGGREAQILYETALAMERDKLQTAIQLLNSAIEKSPWSYHLHDKLIRIHGRLKQYDKITTLLDDSIERAKNEVGRTKAAGRALAHFQQRKTLIERRKQEKKNVAVSVSG